jgi:hypothetical protein
MSAENFNADHVRAVLGFLLSNPEAHDQGRWFRQNCKTTGCVAGWSSSLAGRTMIRNEPYSNESDWVSVSDEEIQAFLDQGFAINRNVDHWTPRPEFLAARAEYQKKLKAYQDQGEDGGLEFPWEPSPNTYNFQSEPVNSVMISAAAQVDMGISRNMASWLFDGQRKISEITIALGLLLHDNGNEIRALTWAEENSVSNHNLIREIQKVIDLVGYRNSRIQELQDASTRDLNDLKTMIRGAS